MKIMLADDEADIRLAIRRILEKAGYEFCCAADGEEALEVYEREKPDLLILDVMMPHIDGFEVCQTLRDRGAIIPILFLSAKSDLVDKGIGFSIGGDDYITKPFAPKELMMHIKARLKQAERYSRAEADIQSEPQTLYLENDSRTAIVDGRRVSLTPKEYAILLLLAESPGTVFTQDQIVEECWGSDFVGETTSVAVYVRRIREKIEEDPTHPKHLQTVWRVGYKLCL